MGAMSRSFVLGIVVASVTWSISLYLYWSLVQNADSGAAAARATISGSDREREIHNDSRHRPLATPSSSAAAALVVGRHGPSNAIDANSDGKPSAGKDLFLDKMRRYKKQQKQRRISQHLRDELQPHPVVSAIGDEFGMVRNEEDRLLRDSGYKRHAFNILVSNHIGLERPLPDTRHKL